MRKIASQKDTDNRLSDNDVATSLWCMRSRPPFVFGFAVPVARRLRSAKGEIMTATVASAATTTLTGEPATKDRRTATRVIDADVHEMIGNPFEFLKYADEPWLSRIHPDNWMGISIPYSWPTVGGLARPDARPANGMRAGSD